MSPRNCQYIKKWDCYWCSHAKYSLVISICSLFGSTLWCRVLRFHCRHAKKTLYLFCYGLICSGILTYWCYRRASCKCGNFKMQCRVHLNGRGLWLSKNFCHKSHYPLKKLLLFLVDKLAFIQLIGVEAITWNGVIDGKRFSVSKVMLLPLPFFILLSSLWLIFCVHHVNEENESNY